MNDGLIKKLGSLIGLIGGTMTILWKVVPLLWSTATAPLHAKINSLNERVWRLEHPGEYGPPTKP